MQLFCVFSSTPSESTAAALANLGSVLHSLGRLREASTKLQAALDILIALHGDAHSDTATTRQLLSKVEREMSSGANVSQVKAALHT